MSQTRDVTGEVLPRRWSSVPWRGAVFATLFVAYLLLTLGVIFRSPVLTLDQTILNLHLPRQIGPDGRDRVAIYVMLGQRAPSTLIALPWIAWAAWRARSVRPLVMIATALLVLNVTVGVVKLLIGRIGPLATPDVHAVFAGGNIYPSGHVSNAVVLYGVIALLAVRWRRLAIGFAVFVSLTVGIGTLYLRTHWISDVVGGWLAGGLVLLALPWLMPTAERACAAVAGRVRAVRLAARRRTAPHVRPVRPAVPVPAPALVATNSATNTATAERDSEGVAAGPVPIGRSRHRALATTSGSHPVSAR